MMAIGELRAAQAAMADIFEMNYIKYNHLSPKTTKAKQDGFTHVLMIKEHNITGLRYLCKHSFKTGHYSSKKCFGYLGSGTRWLNHLKKHGRDISTIILYTSDNYCEFKNVAFSFSLALNVVDDPSWANIIFEKGDGGDMGMNGNPLKKEKQSNTIKETLRKTPKEVLTERGKKGVATRRANGSLEATGKKISARTPRGKDHWNFTGFWVVNHRVYETINQAVIEENLDQSTIVYHCQNPEKVFKKDGKCGTAGKTRRECGFYRLSSDGIEQES